ncbi:MAG: hypothetical protein ACSLFO_00245 [Acidimicrobiales bacterium]
MSETTLFIIGAIVFAITIYGAVMAGGLALTKGSLLENDQYRRRVADDQVGPGLPTDAKF